MGEPDDTTGLHRLVLHRLDSIERKIDDTFDGFDGRMSRVESWVDTQIMLADLRAERVKRLSGRLAAARQWVTFAVGTGTGIAGLMIVTRGGL